MTVISDIILWWLFSFINGETLTAGANGNFIIDMSAANDDKEFLRIRKPAE
jgi:hypothetical protein